MKLPEKLNHISKVPKLTSLRIFLALLIAASADGLQFLFGGLGWIGPDQVIDVATMLLTTWILGFHWLLLPTFVLEFIPLADDLPTWTACVLAVIVLRRRQQRQMPPTDKPVIDV